MLRMRMRICAHALVRSMMSSRGIRTRTYIITQVEEAEFSHVLYTFTMIIHMHNQTINQ